MTRYHEIPGGTAMKSEPVLTGASLLALVGAVLTVLVAFGVDITAEQRAAILGLVTVIAPVVVALIVRQKVTPVA